jgi:hypothetical protein
LVTTPRGPTHLRGGSLWPVKASTSRATSSKPRCSRAVVPPVKRPFSS